MSKKSSHMCVKKEGLSYKYLIFSAQLTSEQMCGNGHPWFPTWHVQALVRGSGVRPSTATIPGWTRPGPVDYWGCSEIPQDLKPLSQRLNGRNSHLVSGRESPSQDSCHTSLITRKWKPALNFSNFNLNRWQDHFFFQTLLALRCGDLSWSFHCQGEMAATWVKPSQPLSTHYTVKIQ